MLRLKTTKYTLPQIKSLLVEVYSAGQSRKQFYLIIFKYIMNLLVLLMLINEAHVALVGTSQQAFYCKSNI